MFKEAKKKLILIGGGGHCTSCIDVIEQEDKYIIEGILDLKENIGKEILGHKIIAADDRIAEFVKKDFYFLITIGQIKTADPRVRLFQALSELGAKMASVVSPRAYVSSYAKVGIGSIVLHGATINANARVGFNTIINTNALVEHDSIIGNHCHISTAAVVNGNCRIGDQSFIGSNSVLKEGIAIEDKSIIPAGSFCRGK